MGAEIVWGAFERLEPARDSGGQRLVDILKGLLGGLTRGGMAGYADTIEDTARLGLLPGFVAEERIFERDVFVGRVEPHGLSELIAGGFVFPHFQQGVGKILVDGRTIRRRLNGLLKTSHGLVVILNAKGVVGFSKRRISGVRRLRGERGGEDNEDYSYHLLALVGY